MKTYVDGLIGQQRLYNASLFIAFVNFVVIYVLKFKAHISEPVFSSIPIIGIKAPNDLMVTTLLFVFTTAISIWVSVEMLWWLHSFHKNHPNEDLDINYLSGLLFMPGWMRWIAGVIMFWMVNATFQRVGDAPFQNVQGTWPEFGLLLLYLLTVLPLFLSKWIRRTFQKHPPTVGEATDCGSEK